MYLERQQKIYMKTAQDATKKIEKYGDRHARAKAIEDSCLKVQEVLEPTNHIRLKSWLLIICMCIHHVTESK